MTEGRDTFQLTKQKRRQRVHSCDPIAFPACGTFGEKRCMPCMWCGAGMHAVHAVRLWYFHRNRNVFLDLLLFTILTTHALGARKRRVSSRCERRNCIAPALMVEGAGLPLHHGGSVNILYKLQVGKSL